MILNRLGKPLVLPTKQAFALAMLAVLKSWIGAGRFNDREQITRILAVSDLPFAEGDEDTPFCDPGVTAAACKSLAVANGEILTDENAVEVLKWYRPHVDAHYFVTSSSCTQTRELNPSLWLSVDDIGDDVDILPGWLILFDFSTPTNFDRHIGIVREDAGDEIDDAEANTTANGHSGMIAAKTRNWNNIWGFLRIY